MKLKELIGRVDKSNKFKDTDPYSEIVNEFDIYDNLNTWDSKIKKRLECYFIESWYCTDSYVGVRVYFLDDKVVAISKQCGRKYDQEFKWISKDLFNKTKDHVMEFVENNDPSLSIIDLDEEWEDGYSISYYEQLFDHHKESAFIGEEEFEILSKVEGSFLGKKVVVRSKYTNESKEVRLSDLVFKYNIRK